LNEGRAKVLRGCKNAVLRGWGSVAGIDISKCLVCREQRGEVVLPGGFLINDDSVVAFHCPPVPGAETPYLGYLFVTSRRHVPSFAELQPGEAAAMGTAIAALSAALKTEGAERVYVISVGHAWPHLHVHLIPRWPETPAEVSWMNVDDWEGARRGGASDVEAMTLQLRTRITAN
jgi:diadenosine tetraphosphate (Ap4A) HIT family hydrolase